MAAQAPVCQRQQKGICIAKTLPAVSCPAYKTETQLGAVSLTQRQPRQSVLLAAVQNKKQHLRRIRSGDEFALSAADFFPPLQGRGLSRRLAPRNDRQKADADLRLQVRPDGENLQPSTRPFLATVLREKRAVPSWFVQIILRQPHKILLRMVQNRLGQRPVAPILVQILSRP